MVRQTRGQTIFRGKKSNAIIILQQQVVRQVVFQERYPSPWLSCLNFSELDKVYPSIHSPFAPFRITWLILSPEPTVRNLANYKHAQCLLKNEPVNNFHSLAFNISTDFRNDAI